MAKQIKLFDVPTSQSVINFWAAQDQALLNSAAEKIESRGANPWVFVADEAHFAQFATAAERAAYEAMTPEETSALIGHWDNAELPARTIEEAAALAIGGRLSGGTQVQLVLDHSNDRWNTDHQIRVQLLEWVEDRDITVLDKTVTRKQWVAALKSAYVDYLE